MGEREERRRSKKRRVRERIQKSTAHARERAKQHYGLILTHEEILLLGKKIEDFLNSKDYLEGNLAEVVPLGEFPDTFPPRALFTVLFKGRPVYVIYSSLIKIVFTVLSLENGEEKAKALS